MPEYNYAARKLERRAIKSAEAKAKLAELNSIKPQCTAITRYGQRCKALVDGLIDEKMLCHVHHPDRTFQQQRETARLANKFFNALRLQQK